MLCVQHSAQFFLQLFHKDKREHISKRTQVRTNKYK